MTCWRRLRTWQQAEVWEALHQRLLRRLNAPGKIDWSRAAADASNIWAFVLGVLTGASGRSWPRRSKHHLLVDATGVPLVVALTGGNRNDVTQVISLLEQLHARPVAGTQVRVRNPLACVITCFRSSTHLKNILSETGKAEARVYKGDSRADVPMDHGSAYLWIVTLPLRAAMRSFAAKAMRVNLLSAHVFLPRGQRWTGAAPVGARPRSLRLPAP